MKKKPAKAKNTKTKKKKVDAIPKNYPVLTPHLTVRGGAEALEFYKKAFGAKERMRMLGPNGAIGHAELQIGPSLFMLADEYPGGGGGGVVAPTTLNGTTLTLMIYVKDVDAAFARALAAGATQSVPVQDMFYGDRMGVLKDPFGHAWMLATHIEDVTPKEMAKRSKEAMEKMMAQPPPAPAPTV
ncbi:MAG TPA: VOC family protein [Planctomycetota bacterium]|nr:VOC family protein [Planctomycetota bacterium]